jgi:hypothetical protein
MARKVVAREVVMKIGIKLTLFWVATLALFAGVGMIFLFYPGWLSGVQGPFILFFLGYCAIIVVAQAFAFVEMILGLRENPPEKSRRHHAGIESA